MHRSIRRNICILATLFFVLTLWGTVSAKEKQPRTPFPDPYQEYIYDVNDFYRDQQDYNSAASQYKAYQTAQSKEDALDAAKTMLESGRIALKQYLFLLSENLTQQTDFNPRVKQAIMADLSAHNAYLDEAAKAIAAAQTISQVNDLGTAMDLRVTYIKATGTQGLSYIDAVTNKKRIEEARILVNRFNTIMAGYPEDNRSRGIVLKWAEEAIRDLANNENKLAEFVDSLYPTEIQTRKTTFYEENRTVTNLQLLQEVNTTMRNYANKFKEMNQIARSAYQEL